MGIHGDKSQQERDWVLNGEMETEPPGRRCWFQAKADLKALIEAAARTLADVSFVTLQSSDTAKLQSSSRQTWPLVD